MVGKQLSALLQILRAAGVTDYQTPELTLHLGPAPAPKGSRALEVSPEALATGDATPDDDEEPPDFRFALERMNRHFPRKVDPRKNRAAQ